MISMLNFEWAANGLDTQDRLRERYPAEGLCLTEPRLLLLVSWRVDHQDAVRGVQGDSQFEPARSRRNVPRHVHLLTTLQAHACDHQEFGNHCHGPSKRYYYSAKTIVFDLHQTQQGHRPLSGSGSQEDALQLFRLCWLFPLVLVAPATWLPMPTTASVWRRCAVCHATSWWRIRAGKSPTRRHFRRSRGNSRQPRRCSLLRCFIHTRG
jgi:hypothetical protein